MTRPLSFVQQRLWIADQLSGGSGALNLPLAIELAGPLNPAALEQAIAEVARRHEVLRTVYGMRDGEPYQQVGPAGAVRLACIDLSTLHEPDRRRSVRALLRAEAHRPFDLARDPAMRALLVRTGAEEHCLALTRHHIASDGWSLGILLGELASLYERYWRGAPSALPELRIQYADYAHWERAGLTEPVVADRLAFWRRQLAGCAPELTLGRGTGVRTPVAGAVECRAMPLELYSAAVGACRRLAATRFMFACAAYLVLLHYRSNETDLVVGTDVTRRSLRAAEALIGCFINRVPLRVDLSGNPTFRELVLRVKSTTVAAHAHADVPFERIVAALNPERPSAGEPLFQVMFGLHAAPAHAPYWNLTLHRMREQRLVDCPNERSQFPLSLYVTEGRHGFVAEARYDAGRFTRTSIVEMLAHYEEVMRCGVENPGVRLNELTGRLAEADRHAVRTRAARFHARRQHMVDSRAAAPRREVR